MRAEDHGPAAVRAGQHGHNVMRRSFPCGSFGGKAQLGAGRFTKGGDFRRNVQVKAVLVRTHMLLDGERIAFYDGVRRGRGTVLRQQEGAAVRRCCSVKREGKRKRNILPREAKGIIRTDCKGTHAAIRKMKFRRGLQHARIAQRRGIRNEHGIAKQRRIAVFRKQSGKVFARARIGVASGKAPFKFRRAKAQIHLLHQRFGHRKLRRNGWLRRPCGRGRFYRRLRRFG